MRSDKSDTPGSSRQKLIIGGLILVIIIIIWQVMGLFGGKSEAPAPEAKPSTSPAMANTPPNPQQSKPAPAELAQAQPQTPPSPAEIELRRLQQETQAKYLAALNELQMLKVAREIAEANQAIMTAKLATVTAEKNIVNLLVPQQTQLSAQDYAKGLVTPGSGAPTTTQSSQPASAPLLQEVKYSVISVSLLQYRWSAVLGYQGNLYNVHVGDILPPDGSTVVAISKTGVVLERNGVKKKVSLVPAI